MCVCVCMGTLVVVYNIYSGRRYNIKAFKDNTGEKITSCRECRRRRAPSSLLVAIVKYDGGGDETSGESVNGGVTRRGWLETAEPFTVYLVVIVVVVRTGRSHGFCVRVHTPFPSPPTYICPVILAANVPYNI